MNPGYSTYRRAIRRFLALMNSQSPDLATKLQVKGEEKQKESGRNREFYSKRLQIFNIVNLEFNVASGS